MNKFNYKQFKVTDWINVFALLLCVGGIVANRFLSAEYFSFSSTKPTNIWFTETVAIIIGFVFINNLKVRFYLILAAVLTYLINWSAELFLSSSLSEFAYLHYLYNILVLVGSYIVFTNGPMVIGLFLKQTLDMEVGAGVFISSTDYYIAKLHRYMIAFHTLVFGEYLLRHGNPLPEIYDTSNLLILYNLEPFGITIYVAAMYGLLIREALFTPED